MSPGGAVAVVQRFGRALNLNVHIHALVLDGVFADKGGGLTFVACDEISDMDAAEALAGIVPSVRALLARRGCDDAERARRVPGGGAHARPPGVSGRAGHHGAGPSGRGAHPVVRCRPRTPRGHATGAGMTNWGTATIAQSALINNFTTGTSASAQGGGIQSAACCR